MASKEEQVEFYYKKLFEKYKIKHFAKTESINSSITKALDTAVSKSGNSGKNYPDIKLLLEHNGRRIPVMIEAKGEKDKLEKLDKNNEIIGVTLYDKDTASHKKGEKNYSYIEKYAVNGALHYGEAILDYTDYKEVIIIGINGYETDKKGNILNPELKAYYVSLKNKRKPQEIKGIDSKAELLKDSNLKKLFKELDELSLTEEEIEALRKKAEVQLETKIKSIHQKIYEDKRIKNSLQTNDKLFLFSGLIMAGLTTKGLQPLEASDLKSNDNDKDNDGIALLNRIEIYLDKKNCSKDKIDMILPLLKPVFTRENLYKPHNGESILKELFIQIKEDIIPCLESDLHLDFTGKIFNSLNDWVQIENDKENDVVLTPRYVTNFMARLAQTDKDSYVWDNAMGSGGFLVSALDLMIKDATNTIKDSKALEKKIKDIKEKQLLGIEILSNIYILAILNMILMGDGSSNAICGDSHDYKKLPKKFPANVYLLNPPYSAEGKGFVFVEEALSMMLKGYGCVLIQDSAGNGQGLPYTKRILEHHTLIASIKMPMGLFGNKASVSVYIFLFKINRKHEIDDKVKFIDFSEDGYSRQNRKKSSQEVNLRDTDHAKDRYDEIVQIVLNKKPKTNYYTKENGKVIEDTISLEGNDWLFTQHIKINTKPTEEDFKKTVSNYLSWKVSTLLKENEK